MRRHGGDMRFAAQTEGACVEIALPGAACASEPGA
jgi:hypothetical protein